MQLNYFYFGLYFFFVCALSFLSNPPAPFMLYGLSQAFTEICFLLFVAHLLHKRKVAFAFFIAASFFLMLVHFTQFIIARVMDTDVLYIFKFFFGSGIDHLIAGFQSMNLNWTMIAMVLCSFLCLPLIAILFYKATLKLCSYKSLTFTRKQALIALSISLLTLLGLDFWTSRSCSSQMHDKYRKNLPLGTTLIPSCHSHVQVSGVLKVPKEDPSLPLPDISIGKKPNLYFFVIEALRKDYLESAETLSAFEKKHIGLAHSYSNANSTAPSWYALFHANNPTQWISARSLWQKGSIPLRYLKKLGYQTHFYSSADLRFFNMDKLILDPQRSLADEVIEFSSDRSLEPWQRDELAMKELQKHKEKEGHAFFIFLDSTHSEYSFPKDFPLKHTPISSEINYLTIHAQSPDLELLKNRYRNSIAYIDSLFAELFDFMKKEELFDSAIISIAADHGEEFFEDGALFHGTHLNDYQTSVPILLKFPSSDWVPQTDTVTHIDLFPSILHYLTKQSDFSSFCEGKSIFAFEKNRRRVAVLQNGNLDPEELLIDGELRVKTCEEGLEVLSGTLEPGALDFLLEKGPFGPPKGEISSIPAGAGSK